ncbi:MAG: sulfurtransferase TusA family protein [Terracoccus sp.]
MSRPGQPTDEGGAGDEAGPDAVVAESGEDAVVDARGLRCPLPVIRLARLVSGDPSVREVTVLATDPAAAHDIPAWCRMHGHTYLGARDDDGYTAHRVGVTPSRPAAVL